MSLQKFLSSKAGKRFYNFAYCWGACLVILGAVFKIAHMPYDTLFLMIGLFTEVTIFFLSGFDAPATDYKWERIFPELEENGKDAGSGVSSLGAIDSKLSERYSKQMEKLESNISKLNEAYEKQLEQISGCAATVNPDALASLEKETLQLAATVKQLNEQYCRMLSAMNVKTK